MKERTGRSGGIGLSLWEQGPGEMALARGRNPQGKVFSDQAGGASDPQDIPEEKSPGYLAGGKRHRDWKSSREEMR